ncbi:MAG: trypsin-like peptidase domain-containing protein [Planctomycetota bacterium]|nr:trypsin-like peptidase domain-containing protein [Planctomycetota bacterium]
MTREKLSLCLVSALCGAVIVSLLQYVPSPIANLAADEFQQLPPLEEPPQRGPQPAGIPVAGFPAGMPADELTAEERVNIAVYETVNRSVVNISTKIVNQTMLFESTAEGTGSGTILDRNGHILTNFHVVEGAREIEVTLHDGQSYEAKLVGRDPASDVAVLRIVAPAEILIPIQFGDSSRLRVGQRVFAIGNPFGLERTMTVGIVSSVNRTLPTRNKRSLKSIIQIDAAINPGNSGGPLLDSRGRLIGVNTAIASKTGQNTGVGFALPVSTITRVVPQLIERGHVIRPDTGIERVFETDRGLVIAALTPGGPAEKAGMRAIRVVRQKKRQGPFVYETETLDRSAADTIIAVDRQKIAGADDFLDIIENKRPGEEVILTVIRDKQEVEIRLRLIAGES